MDRWNFNIDACFNVFMTVAYDQNGVWEIRPPKGKPGDYMVMRALMPQIVATSNCPILLNACNNFRLKPLTLEIMARGNRRRAAIKRCRDRVPGYARAGTRAPIAPP